MPPVPRPTEKAKPRTLRPRLIAAGAATLVLAALVGWYVWWDTHTDLRIDNPGAEPLQIWIDGKRALVVQPGDRAKTPIRLGARSLGYSILGETEPDDIVRVMVRRTDYLYNPGRTGCYYSEILQYSTRPETLTMDWKHIKVLPRRQVYVFSSHVDYWFDQKPSSMLLTQNKSATRFLFDHNGPCLDLLGRGCSDVVVDQLISCQQQGHSKDEMEVCLAKAEQACGSAEP